MSHWSSESAILRDLSQAQGGAPDGSDAPRVRPLCASERPPRLCLHEETEEAYFQHCVGDGDALVKPDLKLIRHMLDMVRDLSVSEDEVKTTDVAVIRKLNPNSPEFIPCNGNNAAETKAAKQTPAAAASPLENVPFTKSTTLVNTTKRSRQRNIALESFRVMQSGERNDDAEHSIQPLRLLKPEDLISFIQENANEMCASASASMQKGQVKRTKTDIPEKDGEHYDTKVKNEAVQKVNEWMTQTTSPTKSKPAMGELKSKPAMVELKSKPAMVELKSKPAMVELNPRNMFKKKSKPEADPCQQFMNPLSMFKTKALDESKVMESNKPSCKGNSAYVPSTHAGEYYQKYLEKSQLKEYLHDDIWTKAEKKMKEIDERKRLRAAAAPELVNTTRARPPARSESEPLQALLDLATDADLFETPSDLTK